MTRPYLWLLQLLSLTTIISASTSNWTKPNSQSPSFTDTFIVGETVFISWLSLNDSISDLWLTRYNATPDNDFAVRLQVARNLSLPSDTYSWIIGVAETEIEKDTRFIFQFLPTGSAYDVSQPPQIPSPPFNIITLNQRSPPNGTVGAPSVTPSSTNSFDYQSPTSFPTSAVGTSNDDVPSTGTGTPLSKNVAIGVAIGALVLAVATIIGAFFVIRGYKRPKPSEDTDEDKITGPYEILGSSRQPTELNTKETSVHEMSQNKETKIHGGESSVVHEISTTIKKPGLHELPA